MVAEQTILVTGGAGFIGTHTVVQLLRDGFNVHIIDNFDNSSMEAVNRVRELVGPKLSKRLEFTKVSDRFFTISKYKKSCVQKWAILVNSIALAWLQGDLRYRDDLDKLFSKVKYVDCFFFFLGLLLDSCVYMYF